MSEPLLRPCDQPNTAVLWNGDIPVESDPSKIPPEALEHRPLWEGFAPGHKTAYRDEHYLGRPRMPKKFCYPYPCFSGMSADEIHMTCIVAMRMTDQWVRPLDPTWPSRYRRIVEDARWQDKQERYLMACTSFEYYTKVKKWEKCHWNEWFRIARSHYLRHPESAVIV